MRAPRPIPLALAVLSLVVFVTSGALLAKRVVQYNRTERRALFYLRPIGEMEFTYSGRPVEITERIDESGMGEVIVRYGEDQVELPITIPVRFTAVPGLAKHSDWLRVLLVREGEGFDAGEVVEDQRDGSVAGKAAIVVRVPPPGADPESRGQLARSEWRFDFYVLDPAGGIERLPRLRFPESERAYRRRVAAAEEEGRDPPPRHPRELQEGTWQYDAAMSVMPPGAGPRRALPGALMHWTFPIASLSLLVLIVSLGFAFAPRRPDSWDSEGRPTPGKP